MFHFIWPISYGPIQMVYVIWPIVDKQKPGKRHWKQQYRRKIFHGHMHQSACISGLKYSYGTLKFSGTPNQKFISKNDWTNPEIAISNPMHRWLRYFYKSIFHTLRFEKTLKCDLFTHFKKFHAAYDAFDYFVVQNISI